MKNGNKMGITKHFNPPTFLFYLFTNENYANILHKPPTHPPTFVITLGNKKKFAWAASKYGKGRKKIKLWLQALKDFPLNFRVTLNKWY